MVLAVFPNKKLSFEHSGIKVGRPAINSLSWDHGWHIEGNIPHCGPLYIAVFGETIPLLIRIMWALTMYYPNHFIQYTQEKIRDFL